MKARTSQGVIQSRNYAATLSLGVTYVFTQGISCCEFTYMPLANHSNFLVDINSNQ
jgi:hypothetical protein